jgi:release factor glutamine methyltransferase
MAATAAATVGEALRAATDALGAAGVVSPRLDAEVLLAEATGRDRATLAADPEDAIAPGAGRRFGVMVRRRLRREPVAYILGRKGFRRIELEVDRRVLIPRPETELLVEIALELGPASVLDVGTGSGAVALAIADEIPGAAVTATDVSAEALAVARANAARLELRDRVRFAAGSLPERGRFDLLVANLPYVGEGEWERLPPEIREFEPRGALVAGPSGLEAIESMLGALGAAGVNPEAIALEAGAGQAQAVSGLVDQAGFGSTQTRRDLAGIERAVVARR